MSFTTTEGTVGMGLKRVSASKPPAEVKIYDKLAILVDVSSCIGCKGCEAACVQWHDLKPPLLSEAQAPVGYQSYPDLMPSYIHDDEVQRGRNGKRNYVVYSEVSMHALWRPWMPKSLSIPRCNNSIPKRYSGL